MKKITFLFLLLPFLVLSQIDLLQTTNNVITTNNSIACGNNSSGYTTENNYARLYNLAALGYSSFQVTKVTFGIESFSLGTASTYGVDVEIYASSGGVTLSNLTYLGGQTVNILPSMVGQLVEVTLTTPVTVTSAEMLINIYAPTGVTTTTTFYIGTNSNGQTSPSYILAETCGITTLTDYASIGFPNVHLVLFPSGNATLGTEDFASQKAILLYPNPVQDVLNISLPQDEIIKDVTLYSVLGNKVMQSNSNTLDVRILDNGIYYAQITTENRVVTQKFVKK